MNPTVVQSVLGGVILAAILWLARAVSTHGETLAVIKTVLIGAEGTNGLRSEVQTLRSRTHEHSNELHSLRGSHDLLKQRVDVLEQA